VADGTTLAQVLAADPPGSIGEVVARMEAIDAALPAADGVGWFTKLYLAVTRDVGTALIPGTFRDPAFVLELDLAFAGLFFDALRGSLRAPPAAPKAWAPLLEARATRGVAPIQFALAGMNAHINRDLPIALVTTCEEAGVDLAAARPQHADFERVNALLAATEQRVKAEFATGVVGVVDVALGDVDDRIAMWNVGRAREAAWVQAQTLWALRLIPPLQREAIDTLDHVVGFAGRGLLVPVA
jgi:Family of unknown function (DUF5995)